MLFVAPPPPSQVSTDSWGGVASGPVVVVAPPPPWCCARRRNPFPPMAKVTVVSTVSPDTGLPRFWGSISAPGAHWASFCDHSPPVFAPTSANNLEYFLAMSKKLAHPLHPVYDDGKGGGWKWLE